MCHTAYVLPEILLDATRLVIQKNKIHLVNFLNEGQNYVSDKVGRITRNVNEKGNDERRCYAKRIITSTKHIELKGLKIASRYKQCSRKGIESIDNDLSCEAGYQ